MQLRLPKWFDLHTHIRQDGLMAPIIGSQIEMGCAGILAMPNTKPPVAKIFKDDDLPYWSIEEYQDMLMKAGANHFEQVITPLYLTKDTTPHMIEAGSKAGILQACKYYPPHGTTGADFGAPFQTYIDNGVFKAMQDCGVILCIHGEEHGMEGKDYISRSSSAEEYFYQNRVPKLLDALPDIKLACEHVTTKVAVNLVKEAGENVAASITPQHLLYTIGDLLMGLKYHLYCLPLLKFEEDRQALRDAVTDEKNTKFYAGTDSAPHTEKATPCGCAAGCFTGGIAPQLYAQAFEEAGVDLSVAENQQIFQAFLCDNGPAFYGIKPSSEQFTLVKEEQDVKTLETPDGPVTPLPLGLNQNTVPWLIS